MFFSYTQLNSYLTYDIHHIFDDLILAGAIYARLKGYENALLSLEKSLAIAKSIPSTYLTICGLFNQSYTKLMGEPTVTVLEDLQAGLSIMKIKGYNHFWSWEPAMMTKLLGLAVQRDIEKPFAVNLAKLH